MNTMTHNASADTTIEWDLLPDVTHLLEDDPERD